MFLRIQDPKIPVFSRSVQEFGGSCRRSALAGAKRVFEDLNQKKRVFEDLNQKKRVFDDLN
jgi:hypothetical protein